MSDAPFALALAAGVLAAVNPCGFALLPAYLSFLVLDDGGDRAGGAATGAKATGDTTTGDTATSDTATGRSRAGAVDDGGRRRALGRALALTGAMTLGFTAVFGAFGLLAAPVADVVSQRLPWVGIGVGLLLAVAGIWLLAGRQLPTLRLNVATNAPVTRRFGAMTLFGASYATASLGCTIGPFLAVVVAGFRADSILAGIGLFVAYAAGMAAVVGAVALAVALAQVSFVRGLRRAAATISRAAGLLLLVAGGYVAWYGWYEIRVFRDPDTTDPVVEFAAEVQSAIAGWLDRFGPVGVAVVAGLLALAVIGVRRRRRPRAATSRTSKVLPPR